MFAKLSENRDRPMGKCANEMTIKNIATQYDLGRPEWYGGWESSTKASFKVCTILIDRNKSILELKDKQL
jgi:hypothetical protein